MGKPMDQGAGAAQRPKAGVMGRASAVLAAVAAIALIAVSSGAADGRHIHVSIRGGSATPFVDTSGCPGFATVLRVPELQVGVYLETEWDGDGYTDGQGPYGWVEMKIRISGSGSDPNTGATYKMKGKLEDSYGPHDLLGVGDIRITRDDGMRMAGEVFFNVAGPMSPEIGFQQVTECG